MKVRFEQSGGFAGLLRQCELTLDEIPAELASLVRELANQPPPTPPSDPEARDTVGYTLRILSDKKDVTLTFDSLGLPERFAPLITYLSEASKPMRLR